MCKDLLGFLMFSLLWPLHRTCLWHKFSIHQFVVAGCQNYPASYHLFPLQFVRFLGNTATGVNAVKPCLCLFLNTYPVLCQIKRVAFDWYLRGCAFMAEQRLRIQTSPVGWSRGLHLSGKVQRGAPVPRGVFQPLKVRGASHDFVLL